MTRRQSKQNGFTLIEISVVVLIFAMFAALVLPRVIPLNWGDAVRKFTIELPGAIRTIRADAMNRGETLVLAFDSQLGQLIVQSSEGQQIGNSISVPDDIEVSGARIGKNDATGTDWELRFYPDGTCDGGGISFSFDGKAQSLQLFAETGAGRWVDGELPEIGTDEWSAGELEQRVPEGG